MSKGWFWRVFAETEWNMVKFQERLAKPRFMNNQTAGNDSQDHFLPEWKWDVELLAKIITKRPNTIRCLSEAAYRSLFLPGALLPAMKMDLFEALWKIPDIRLLCAPNSTNFFERVLQSINLSSTHSAIRNRLLDQGNPHEDIVLETRELKLLIKAIREEPNPAFEEKWNFVERRNGILGMPKERATPKTCVNIIEMLLAELEFAAKYARWVYDFPVPEELVRESKEIWSDLNAWLCRILELWDEQNDYESAKLVLEAFEETHSHLEEEDAREIQKLFPLVNDYWKAKLEWECFWRKVEAFWWKIDEWSDELFNKVADIPDIEQFALLSVFMRSMDLYENAANQKELESIADAIISKNWADWFFECLRICNEEAEEKSFEEYGQSDHFLVESSYLLERYLEEKYKSNFVTGELERIRYESIMPRRESGKILIIQQLTPETFLDYPRWTGTPDAWLSPMLEKIAPWTVSSSCELALWNELIACRKEPIYRKNRFIRLKLNATLKEPVETENQNELRRPPSNRIEKHAEDDIPDEVLNQLKSIAKEAWLRWAIHPTDKSSSRVECATRYAEGLLAEGKSLEAVNFLREFERQFGEIPQIETRYQGIKAAADSWMNVQEKLSKVEKDAEVFIASKEKEIAERSAALEKRSEELWRAILRKRVDLEYALNKSAIEELGFDEPKFYEEVRWNVHEYWKEKGGGIGMENPQSNHFNRSASKFQNFVLKPLFRLLPTWFWANEKTRLNFVLPTLRASYLGEWKEFLMEAGRKYVRSDTWTEKPDIENIKAVDERMSRMIGEFDEILTKDQDRNMKGRIFWYLILFFVFETVALLWGVWYVIDKLWPDAVKFESLLKTLIWATIAQITAMIFFIVKELFAKGSGGKIRIPEVIKSK